MAQNRGIDVISSSRPSRLAIGFLSTLISLVPANSCKVANHRKAKSHDEQNVHNLLCKDSFKEVMQVGSFSCVRSPSLSPTQSKRSSITLMILRQGKTGVAG